LAVAARDDTYRYGRTLQVYLQSVLLAFRLTGDLALLDHVDVVAQRMRAELRDSWRGTLDGTDGTRDGYLNWVWRYSSGDKFVGKDTGWVDEMKTHALVALIAVALDTNRDLPSPGGRDYGAHADFWKDYLVHHFEAKWRERRNLPSGFPLLTMTGMHTYATWLRWHHYMGVLTGDAGYAVEAARMADLWWDEMRPVATPAGVAYVWPRSLLSLSNGVGNYLMPTTYASMVYADVVELHLEGFHRWASVEEMRRFARTFTEFVMDSSNPIRNGLAADIGGGVARAGLRSDASNWPRMTTHGFWLSGYPHIAAWDDTEAMIVLTQDAYERRGPNVGMMLEAGALASSVVSSFGSLDAVLAAVALGSSVR
jgi:hypothetical protein